MKDVRHLFVYGTLGPGKPNEHVLTEMEGIYHQAVLAVVLLMLGGVPRWDTLDWYSMTRVNKFKAMSIYLRCLRNI